METLDKEMLNGFHFNLAKWDLSRDFVSCDYGHLVKNILRLFIIFINPLQP